MTIINFHILSTWWKRKIGGLDETFKLFMNIADTVKKVYVSFFS